MKISPDDHALDEEVNMLDYIKIINFSCAGEMSAREIARQLGVSKSGVSNFLHAFNECDELTYPLPPGTTNIGIYNLVYKGQGRPSDHTCAEPEFEQIRDAMQTRKNMTLKYQWNRYRRQCEKSGLKPYSYRQFCKRYGDWCTANAVTCHFDKRPGERMEVDFAGQTFQMTDRIDGETHTIVVFVAVLPYSSYTYAEGMLSTREAEWIKVNNHALEYFGGVPATVVPDNCKQAVLANKDWIDPELNPMYEEWAMWNGTCILPAKVRRPTYKSTVEGAVGILEKGIFHDLEDTPIFSLNDFNQRLWAGLSELNKRPFSKKEHDRQWYFENEEKSTLQPLPPHPFEIAERRQAKVYRDCHVRFNNACYSVDHHYANQTVQICATTDRVKIYTMAGDQLADWPRASRPGQWCTDPNHMPVWFGEMQNADAQDFLQKGRAVGPSTEKLMRAILDTCGAPMQAFRRFHGLLGFAGKYSEAALEECCRQALTVGKTNYRYIKDTIQTVADEIEEQKLEKACRDDAVLPSRDTSVDALLARTAALVQKGGATE